MRGNLAWLIFGLASLSCLFWIGFSVRDDMHEDNVFHDVIQKRINTAISPQSTVYIGVAGDWKNHKDILHGVEQAAQKLNASGGILDRKVALVIEDDKGTIDGALLAAQSFAVKPEIAFVIGHTQLRLNEAVAQHYEFYGILCIAPNTVNSFTSNNNSTLLFENGMAPRHIGEAIIDLAKTKDWKRLGLLYTRNDQTMRRARQFESMVNKHEIQVPLSFGYEGLKSDITEHMITWKRELDLDAMILAIDQADMPSFIFACRKVGISAPLVIISKKRPSIQALKEGENLLYWIKQKEDENLTVKRLMKQVKKSSGQILSTNMTLGYDALTILAQKIEEAGSFVPADVAATFKEAKVNTSVSGTLRFDKQGNAVKQSVVFTAD